MSRAINNWVRHCHECGSREARPRQIIPPLRSLQGGAVGDRWALDVAGPLPKTKNNNRYVIAAVEYVTRYAVAIPVTNHTAEDIAQFLMHNVVFRFGVFRELLTGNAPEMVGKSLDILVTLLQAHQTNLMSYRPQMIGLVERFHRTWKDCVSLFIDEEQTNWDQWINGNVYE